jgi:hypothetical protein
MIEEKYLHIELISPRSWGCAPLRGEVVAEFEAVCPDGDNLLLTIPLHEDFFDFCKSYCDQYKVHIENKLK